jgi:uncharacterized protein YcnI
MKRLALLVALALGALLVVAAPAFAHVTVGSTDAKPGGYAVVTLRVPTESDTASTTRVVVSLPPFGSVAVRPTPGWTATTRTAKLAEPITTDDGAVTSAVARITWTAAPGAAIRPGQFQEFDLSVGPLPNASSVSFPTVQYYSDGTTVKWIEKAAPGSSVEPDHPAPTLSLQTPAAVTKVEKASTTAPTVLSIIALVLAAGAVGYAVVGRAKARAT